MHIRLALLIAVMTALPTELALGQTEWTRPSDVSSGGPGQALVVVDSVDQESRRIRGAFAESEFGVTLNVNSGTRFRGFANEAAAPDVIGFGGLADVRPGDRIRVFGTGASNGVIQAEDVRLVGRRVVAGTVPSQPGVIEGVVRSVNRGENRFTVETADRRLWTVVGEATTPVEFEGRRFAIGNLETGDSVRVDVSSWDGTTPLASRVTVTRDARQAVEAVTSLSGRVTAVRSAARTIVVETARGDLVSVDVTGTTDEAGRRLGMADFSIGQEIDVVGRRASDGTFRATTLRGIESSVAAPPLRTVDISGTLSGTPDEAGWIRVETDAGIAHVLVDPEQPVRYLGARWFRGADLQRGDRVRVRGVDAGDGAIIAQVIEVDDVTAD